MSSFSAASLMPSPSLMSIARVALASRPALNRPCGSSSEAPLKKLILTWSLKAPTATTLPLCDQMGVFHFHSSTRSGAGSRISLRSRASIAPRQSPSSLMYLVICSNGFIGFKLLKPMHCTQSKRVCFVQKRQLLVGSNNLGRCLADQVFERPRQVRLVKIAGFVNRIEDGMPFPQEVRCVPRPLDLADST